MFKLPIWTIPLAHWTGLAGAAGAVFLLAQGASAWWLLAWAAGHWLGGVIVSVALHRYFTHGAFTTSKTWRVVLALITPLAFQGSALDWSTAHQTHHTQSDTAGDPHITAWHYLWFKRYRDVPMETWRMRQLLAEDRLLGYVHRYALVIVLVYATVLWLIHPMLLLFGYLAPLGSVHFVGAVHQVSSHRGGEPHDWPWLEWVLPAAGEWNHHHHHAHPRDPRLGRFDYGWWFIRWISTPQVGKATKT